jgi:glycosyltransferase involved in cell wall biosynthesis
VPGLKKPILLSTGRLLPRKGFQYLVKAVHDEAFPFEVHICGDGPLMKELQSLAHNSKTPIIFHGWLDNESPAYIELLSQATYFCLVSAKENASTSLMEALAAGAAVITSNVSGCPESVGEAGICIPPADVDALKKALRQLASDDSYREGFMHNGRQMAIREFEWASISSRYIQLFSEIKGGHEPV